MLLAWMVVQVLVPPQDITMPPGIKANASLVVRYQNVSITRRITWSCRNPEQL